MKKLILSIFAIFILQLGFSQVINGEFISTENGVSVIKVWGTHAERGYAQGYLLAQEIADLWGYYFYYNHYATNYADAKLCLTSGSNFSIPNEYIVEAQNLIQGVGDAGQDITGLDEWDVLLMSSFIDVDGILGLTKSKGPGCSTLISWDDATTGTSLNGKSIATRHTDWGAYTGIIGNDAIVIHIPSETDEQPWVNVGYAGIIAPLSGMNQGGLGVFAQILLNPGMSPHGTGSLGQSYEPYWFSIRKALEKADYNSDGYNDVNDIKDATLSNSVGYAEGFIFTSVAKSINITDERIALIGEVAPTSPFITHRTNTYSDNIPGDNIYSANDQIARNNNNDFCVRYNSVINNIGIGTNFNAQSHWDFLKDYSNSWTMLSWDNIQMMQYIPDDQIFKYASYTAPSTQAYQSPTLTLDFDTIFPNTTSIDKKNANELKIYPNPSSGHFIIDMPLSVKNKDDILKIEIIDLKGEPVFISDICSSNSCNYEIDINDLPKGVYIVSVTHENSVNRCKLIVK